MKNFLAGIIYAALSLVLGFVALSIFIFSSGSQNIYDFVSNIFFLVSMVMAMTSAICCFMAFKAFDKFFKRLKRRARSRY